MTRWDEQGPDGVDVAVVMIESHIPAFIPAEVRVVAWVRNWTDRWAELPYLDRFDAIWCSSSDSASRIAAATTRPVEVVPLAVDHHLFRSFGATRDPRPLVTANFWGADRGLFSEIVAAEEIEFVWYGVRGVGLPELPERIEHRGRADFFDLADAYSRHRVVIDDVIEPAAAYGNQNSRLFEALACGALVVTNTRRGLDELGLGEVPVYEPGRLIESLNAIAGDADASAGLVDRLGTVVLERHTWRHRSAQAGVLLEQLIAAPPVPRDDPFLRFAAQQEVRYRSAMNEVERLQREADALRSDVNALRESTSWRLTAPLRLLRRGRPG